MQSNGSPDAERTDVPNDFQQNICFKVNDKMSTTSATTATTESSVSYIVRMPDTVACEKTSLFEWNTFVQTVETLSRLGNPIKSRTNGVTFSDAPRLGDLIFVVGSTFGRNGENRYVRDFLTFSVRDFTELYMNELVERCDESMRRQIFALKVWLSSRVHFDHRLIVDAAKDNPYESAVRGKRRKTSATDVRDERVIRSLEEAVSGRLVFTDREQLPNRPNDAVLYQIESFSPTFALYTLCNLRDAYSATALADSNRFDERCSPSTSCSSGVGRPPIKRNWYRLTAPRRDVIWPKQCYIVGARDLISQDKTLFRFIEAARRRESTDTERTTVDKRHLYEDRVKRSMAAATTTTGGTPSETSADDELKRQQRRVFGGVKIFNDSSVYEADYDRDRTRTSFGCDDSREKYNTFLALLNGLCVAWGKLNVFEPSVFD